MFIWSDMLRVPVTGFASDIWGGSLTMLLQIGYITRFVMLPLSTAALSR